MNYKNLVKKIELPEGFQPPHKLVFEDLVAKPLTREDLIPDMEAVNSSLEIIRKTRGGSWPEESVSEEFDFLDLAWHEHEFRDNSSFAYAVYDTGGSYIGCFYLYGMGLRTELTEDLASYGVDASWWVTQEAYGQGYYKKLHSGIVKWMAEEFPFLKVYYSNREPV